MIHDGLELPNHSWVQKWLTNIIIIRMSGGYSSTYFIVMIIVNHLIDHDSPFS